MCKMLVGLLVLSLYSSAYAIDTQFNAFGDVSFGLESGDCADGGDRNDQGCPGVPNDEQDTKSSLRGFNLTGTDFVITSDLGHGLTAQSEINLQTDRAGSNDLELDVERIFVNYNFSQQFNVMTGLFFTPIGYINRNMYARAWLMHSIQQYDFSEEDLGLMPTHTSGVGAHGIFDIGKDSLMYMASVGNGRGPDSGGIDYTRDRNNGKEAAALLEYRVSGFKNFRIGLSGWQDHYTTYSSENDNNPRLDIEEVGVDAYLVFENQWGGVIYEYVSSETKDVSETNANEYKFTASTIEVHLNFKSNTIHPYIRKDITKIDSGNSFYNVGIGEYPNTDLTIVGINWDWHTFNRLKAEFGNHDKGPRRDYFAVQTAWAF